jgi:hypothetical protein
MAKSGGAFRGSGIFRSRVFKIQRGRGGAGDDSADGLDMKADPQRTCPTPRDATEPRFAHRISVSRCQDQQRNCFHKCYSCEWNNSYQALKARDERTKRPARARPEQVPVQTPQVESLPELPELTAQFVLSTTE